MEWFIIGSCLFVVFFGWAAILNIARIESDVFIKIAGTIFTTACCATFSVICIKQVIELILKAMNSA